MNTAQSNVIGQMAGGQPQASPQPPQAPTTPPNPQDQLEQGYMEMVQLLEQAGQKYGDQDLIQKATQFEQMLGGETPEMPPQGQVGQESENENKVE